MSMLRHDRTEERCSRRWAYGINGYTKVILYGSQTVIGRLANGAHSDKS